MYEKKMDTDLNTFLKKYLESQSKHEIKKEK